MCIRDRVYSYSTSDRSVEKITRTDLYLVSTDAFKIAEEESQYVPADGQVVEIYVGYSKEVIRRLKEIPAGTRVLFVNVTHQIDVYKRQIPDSACWILQQRRILVVLQRNMRNCSGCSVKKMKRVWKRH